jgi:hypothetical protein
MKVIGGGDTAEEAVAEEDAEEGSHVEADPNQLLEQKEKNGTRQAAPTTTEGEATIERWQGREGLRPHNLYYGNFEVITRVCRRLKLLRFPDQHSLLDKANSTAINDPRIDLRRQLSQYGSCVRASPSYMCRRHSTTHRLVLLTDVDPVAIRTKFQ